MTSVDWLVNQLHKYRVIDINNLSEADMALIEQARQMEKQQTIKFTEDFIEKFTFGNYDGEVYQSKEIGEYFDETYGSKGSDEYTTVNWGGVIQKIPKKGSGELEQINQDNPVTRGSTALVKISKEEQKKLITEIMNEDYIDKLYNMSDEDIDKYLNRTYSNLEISDDDINSEARKYRFTHGKISFREGAKWMREKIKNK